MQHQLPLNWGKCVDLMMESDPIHCSLLVCNSILWYCYSCDTGRQTLGYELSEERHVKYCSVLSRQEMYMVMGVWVIRQQSGRWGEYKNGWKKGSFRELLVRKREETRQTKRLLQENGNDA